MSRAHLRHVVTDRTGNVIENAAVEVQPPAAVTLDVTPVDPSTVSSLHTRFDFSDAATLWKDTGLSVPVTADEDEIWGVTDKTGNGHDAFLSDSNAPTYRTNRRNGLSAAHFNNAALVTENFTQLDQPNTVILVAKNASTWGFFFDSLNVENKRHAMRNADAPALASDPNVIPGGWTSGGVLIVARRSGDGYVDASFFLVDPQEVDEEFHVWAAEFNGASSEIWRDGDSQIVGDAGPDPLVALTLGSSLTQSNALEYMNGDFCEFLLFDTELSNSTRDGVTAYLIDKWGFNDAITPIQGNIYTVSHGGTPTSSPIVSDSSGQVEFWMDFPQDVLLHVTDNSNTAIYPSAPEAPLSFEPFDVNARPDEVPSLNSALQFVHNQGNDVNDGLSWESAKATIVSAYDALPTSGGTIYCGGGVALADEVIQGLWLVGPTDHDVVLDVAEVSGTVYRYTVNHPVNMEVGDVVTVDGFQPFNWNLASREVVAVSGNTFDADLTVNPPGGTAGITQMGGSTSNYVAPPEGWRRAKNLILEGVGTNIGALNSKSPQVAVSGGWPHDNDHPALWFAGLGGTAMEFRNLLFSNAGVIAKIGIDVTDSSADATGDNPGPATGLTFRNCAFAVGGQPGRGPTIEVGYAFWWTFEDCNFGCNNTPYDLTAASTSSDIATFTVNPTFPHNLRTQDTFEVTGVTPSDYNGLWTVIDTPSDTTFTADIGTTPAPGSVFGKAQPIDADSRAAIGAYAPQGGGMYLGRIQNCTVNGGALLRYRVADSRTIGGGIWIKDITIEGGNSTVVSIVREGDLLGGDIGYGWTIEGIERADAEIPAAVVSVPSASTIDPNFFTIRGLNANAFGTPMVVGAPAIVWGSADPTYNQVGTDHSGRITGRHDAARRAFAPSVVRYPNLVSHDSADWSASTGAATVTGGKLAPDGTTNAAEFTSASGSASKKIYSASRSIAEGDWVIFGIWVRGSGALGAKDSGQTVGFSIGTNKFHVAEHNSFPIHTLRGNHTDEWYWALGADRLETVTTSPDTLSVDLECTDEHPMVYYAPILLHIPASEGLSRSEAYELANNLVSYPPDAPAGSLSSLAGTQLLVPGGIGVGNSDSSTTPGSITGNVEIFDETGASLGFIPIYDTFT